MAPPCTISSTSFVRLGLAWTYEKIRTHMLGDVREVEHRTMVEIDYFKSRQHAGLVAKGGWRYLEI